MWNQTSSNQRELIHILSGLFKQWQVWIRLELASTNSTKMNGQEKLKHRRQYEEQGVIKAVTDGRFG